MTIGGKPRRRSTQGEQIAVRAPTNGDKAMMIDGAPLVFVGYGVKAPERGWDDFKGQDMRGKILVMLVNDPDFEGGEGDFGGKAMTYYGRWTYKYEEGARQGAKGVLVIHETEPASYGWATVKNSNTNAMFDIVRKNPAAEHPPLEGWIQRDLAAAAVRRIRHQLRGDEGRRQAQGLQAGRRSRPTSPFTATPRPRSSPRTMSSASCPARRARTRR